MEKLKTENRKCIFRKEAYTFHGFYQKSDVIPPSLYLFNLWGINNDYL